MVNEKRPVESSHVASKWDKSSSGPVLTPVPIRSSLRVTFATLPPSPVLHVWPPSMEGDFPPGLASCPGPTEEIRVQVKDPPEEDGQGGKDKKSWLDIIVGSRNIKL
ncbi:hypothetical protein Salat_2419300 [Sesamum alatum]|uniref:Uncharacterized protein n=1 Tax=Sesamum alatum TaxID=300844 RepID=A0AAE2CFB2_9LAMI|nr:hypothetical protein Salat_2419300 [Sesamum alatum]